MGVANSDKMEPFYWDRYRDTTIGRYLFRREHGFVKGFVGSAIRPHEILDLGCGSGRLTIPLHQEGLHVTGLDLSPTALAAFRQRTTEVSLVLGDASQLPFRDGSFDTVVAIQSFDYIDRSWFLRECHRVLRHAGLLIFDALNRRSYKWLLKNRAGPALDLPSANLDCQEVVGAAVDHGFNVEKISGYNWLPFTRHSNSKLVGAVAFIESALRLDRCYGISPKILIAARKGT